MNLLQDTFTTVYGSRANTLVNGTHFSKLVIKTTGSDLKRVLGEPSFQTSGDDKVRMEWVVSYFSYDEMDEEVRKTFTIYDWKTNPNVDLMNQEYEWHVGTRDNFNNDVLLFIDDLERTITG